MSDRSSADITCLSLDIGGVLLSDGWNQHARALAASGFEFDAAELEQRHDLVFDVAQTDPARMLFVENPPMHLQVAATLGIPGILHTDWLATQSQLAALGLGGDGDHDAVG